MNADGIQGDGNGTITAYGGPTITIANDSPDYLILGAINIPNIPGGAITFTGAAGQTAAQKAGITVNSVDANGDAVVTVNQNYNNGAVGNPSNGDGPALFLMGSILNLGGSITITNASGSLADGSTNYGQSVTLTSPKGVMVVDIPPPGVYYAGSDPYTEWQNYITFPGGNPALGGTLNANLAIAYVVNAEYNSTGILSTSELNGVLYGFAGNPANGTSNVSYVYLGNDVPWGSNIPNDGSAGTAAALSPIGQAYAISGSSSGLNNGYFPVIPAETLSVPGDYSDANLTGAPQELGHLRRPGCDPCSDR